MLAFRLSRFLAMTTVAKPRILLVDDEYKILFTLKSILEKHGYEVCVCLYGAEAIEKVKEEGPFDLLILDYIMPGMRGDVVARIIKARCPDLPILFISAFVVPEEAKGLADAFLGKPEHPDALLDTVHTILERRKRAIGAKA